MKIINHKIVLSIFFLLITATYSIAQGKQKPIQAEGNYDGKYRKGMRHGRGTCVWPDGSKYTGMWKFNTMNGKGVYTNKDGYKYDGYWQNGMKNGRGTLNFPINLIILEPLKTISFMVLAF